MYTLRSTCWWCCGLRARHLTLRNVQGTILKSLLVLSLITICCSNVSAQSTGILANQRDAWGITYTYTGEIKNGLPNGMGVAKYSNGTVVRYVGSFVNGMYGGRGTMLFTSGEFLTGTWVDGKLNGKGANLTKDGSLYVGDFMNGEKNGNGILFYKNNGFMIGGFRNDKLNGRCINLWADGNIMSDNVFVDDKRNGPGFQYEAATKKLYEGDWQDDKWVNASTANFTSFLQQPAFTGESTTEHILMGPVTARGFLRDSSYYYDLAQHKRYFGSYTEGKLDDGILIGDDSTRFIGKLDDNGAKGYCYDFKYGSYYSEGNYTNDLLDGDILDINLKKRTVYYGKSVAGDFTGKAYFFNDKDVMYAGDYYNGDFTGQGFRVESNGRCVAGSWKDGLPVKVTSITTDKGEVISGSPATFADAINIVVKDYANYYDNITGSLSDEEDVAGILLDDADDDSYNDLYNSLVTFPAAGGKDVITTDFDSTNYYSTVIIETTDAVKAKVKYMETGRQLLATVINNKSVNGGKLQGTLQPVASAPEQVVSVFTLPSGGTAYSDFRAWLVFKKGADGNYTVLLELGKKPAE